MIVDKKEYKANWYKRSKKLCPTCDKNYIRKDSNNCKECRSRLYRGVNHQTYKNGSGLKKLCPVCRTTYIKGTSEMCRECRILPENCIKGGISKDRISYIEARKKLCPICRKNVMSENSSKCLKCSKIPENNPNFIDGRTLKVLCPICKKNKMYRGSTACIKCYISLDTRYNKIPTSCVEDSLSSVNLFLLEESYINNVSDIRLECTICNTRFISRYKYIQQNKGLCPKCHSNNNYSKAEKEIASFVRSILPNDMEMIENDRRIIAPLELDIVVRQKS